MAQTQMTPEATLIFMAALYLLGFLVLVLVVRWVFRVNTIVANQERIIEHLAAIAKGVTPAPTEPKRTALEAAADRSRPAAGREADLMRGFGG